jgi:prepilin-type processing-associated H-X9-DG protein
MSNPALQCPHCGQPIAVYAPPEQLMQCPNCQGNFTTIPPAQSEPGLQRVEYATPLGFGGRLLPNNAAKVSLISGIALFFLLLLGFFIAESGATMGAEILIAILILLAPVLAIIFGIIGIVRTRDGRHAGKGMAITGISLGGVGLLLALIAIGSSLLGPSFSSRGTSPRVKCAANLKQIGLAMQLYANENKGLYPPRPEDLIMTQDITTEVFICPSTNDTQATGATTQQQAANLSAGGHDSYIYLRAGKNSNTPATVVLVYEPLKDHNGAGMNVLFADGHVDFISGAMAQKVEAELKAGQNPPPSYK